MRKLSIFRIAGLMTFLITLVCTTIGIITPNAASAATFSISNNVEVYNTGSSGLLLRDAPCGTRIGAKFDGALGVVQDGPVYCENYNRWLIRWSDGLQGWSAENWLRKVAQVTPPTPQQVTLTLYVHENSSTGPVIQGAQVTGTDAAGTSFNQTTNSSGYVAISGIPGTWSLNASRSGYNTNPWSQSITSADTKHAYLVKQVIIASPENERKNENIEDNISEIIDGTVPGDPVTVIEDIAAVMKEALPKIAEKAIEIGAGERFNQFRQLNLWEGKAISDIKEANKTTEKFGQVLYPLTYFQEAENLGVSFQSIVKSIKESPEIIKWAYENRETEEFRDALTTGVINMSCVAANSVGEITLVSPIVRLVTLGYVDPELKPEHIENSGKWLADIFIK